MELKRTHSRFGSNLFLTKKSESEGKSESSSTNKKCQGPDSDWVSRLTVIEKQNKEMIRRYEDMRRQNDKIIQQNETILEMLETQMKLFLDDKTLQKSNNEGTTTTVSSNTSDNVQSTCNSSQSLAISNPLYKFNTNITTLSRMRAKPDGRQVWQQPATVKKSELLQNGRSQPIQKISRAVAVWQVSCYFMIFFPFLNIIRFQHKFSLRL